MNIVNEKIPKNFRLSHNVVEQLERISRVSQIPMTEIVEEAISLYAKQVADSHLENRISNAEVARAEIAKGKPNPSNSKVDAAAAVLLQKAADSVQQRRKAAAPTERTSAQAGAARRKS